MENKKHYLEEISTVVETLLLTHDYKDAAVEAAKHIDKHFFLIYRTLDLPKVETSPSGTGRLPHITEAASKGDTKTMRELAFEYLAMAEYVDKKKAKDEDMKLKTARFNAYKAIFPYQNMHTLGSFDYERDLNQPIQRAVDEIVKLRIQLDK